ncbi:thiamine pyrophosphate-binding protein [Undibacterium sp. TJN19]|uniref:thiamine pyrophosphate-binding protein n=1 Tax=Undibacterium sp. TJN19 TaxID=3413055 RepID=UPI003BF281DD
MNTEKSKLVKVSDYICSRIRELTGSRHVFLLSGGGMMHLLDSVGSSELTPFPLHHEQAAAIAAYAYGRSLNATGVCFVTSGPGATNALTGVAGAYTDSVPMLFISGQVSTLFSQRLHGLRQRGFQEFNIVDVVAPTTKYARFVGKAQDIRYELEKACFLARAGRPGPVWLDLPLDVQAALIDPDSLHSFDPHTEGLADQNPAPEQELVSSILTHLRNSKRPLIVLGHGVWLAGAKDSALHLLGLLQVPVQTTWNAIDLVPEAHPRYFGRANAYGPRYANFIIQNADYLLSIGARLGVQHTGYNVEAFGRAAFVDMVDLDPAEASKPFLKIDRYSRCDAKALINALISELENSQTSTILAPVEWNTYCQRIKHTYPVAPTLEEAGAAQLVDPYYFVDVLSDLLPEDALVPLGSSGTAFTVSGQAFKPKVRQRVFHAKGMAAMGFGMPSAIGASIAFDNKMAITLVGDGGFQLNIQELQTMVHHALPVKIFVVNNDGYHAIRVTQENYFNNRYVGSTAESGVSLPSLKKIADAYGMQHRIIHNNSEVKDVISASLGNHLPEIIEIMVDPHKHLMPKLGSFIKPDGTMASRPLEDLLPLLSREEFRANMYTEPLE